MSEHERAAALADKIEAMLPLGPFNRATLNDEHAVLAVAGLRCLSASAASWRPIDTAPRYCTVDRSGLPHITGWTTETMWVRDADGRVYEAWYVGRGCYWWDADGETECSPVEWMPHPLWRPRAEGEG